jgi:hypothetical protein
VLPVTRMLMSLLLSSSVGTGMNEVRTQSDCFTEGTKAV